ncbi:hexose kinase [Nocardioides sp. YIM 152315]|uniref:1-phosphofructokinase family hexose kinase n=1 Tax=Nocardioides sp. YIM 152315 TaxID=3031760 RepID=UPI0023DA607A|nr:hexose kinase [Nocardioides sp. YIM 152315]MDF1602611.1 hexose kinase [Nocardioides sp. YIM 152315]
MGRLILTITPSPAYDVTYETSALNPGEVHRVSAVHRRPGGKGVNVATVLARLGEPVVAAGIATSEFAADVERLGVPTAFTTASTGVRSTVVVVDGGRATSFWEPAVAPPDPTTAVADLRDRVLGLLPDVGCVAISGSVPAGVGHALPAELARLAHDHGVPCLVDASGEALAAAAAVPGVVLCPNADELAELCGHVADHRDAVAAARSLVDRGAGMVFATRGADGIALATPDGCWLVPAVPDVTGNTTGAGDAAAAAIARGLCVGTPAVRIAEDAVALAAAAVAAPVAGEIDPTRYGAYRAGVVARALSSEETP